MSNLFEDQREAQREWAARPLRARLRVLRRFRHLLAAQASRVAEAAGAGLSRPLAEILSAELIPLAGACRFLEREASRLLAPRRLGHWGMSGRPAWLTGVESEVRREPLGLVLFLAPSNYPLFLPGVQALQALAAGNAVLWKPGRGGRRSAQAVAGLLAAAGLDGRLLRVLPETDEAAREALAAGPDKVLLTSSAHTGRQVLARAAASLIPVTAELSGCDAVFVLPGADLERVARCLRFGLELNGGATCIAPRRVFVPREMAAELADRLAPLVHHLPPVALDVGALALARGLVADALDGGARLLPGTALLPRVREAAPFQPLVVLDASPDMELLQEDLFAPVLAVVPVAGPREALEAAARCPYALGASIFGPEKAARDLAGQVRAGSVTINDLIVPTADPRLPFGGRGWSGFGLTRGAEGLLELTAVKTVSVRRGRRLPHLDERRPEDGELLRGYLAAAHGGGFRERLAGAAALLRAVLQRQRRGPARIFTSREEHA
jgi:acyl-CoA reductase-like NAD-dependent aldehyde dehydrogenase